MADSDKDILITPNTSVATTHPEIKFVGKDNSPMYLRVLDDNTLSFEGAEGQVFSMSPTMSSGDIFSVNDISGIQSIVVNADGTVSIAPVSGDVGIGTTSPNAKLQVHGTTKIDPTGTYSALAGSGSDTSTTAAITTMGASDWYYEYNGYLRRVIGHSTGGDITIGHQGTSTWDLIDLIPGHSGKVRLYSDDPSDASNAAVTLTAYQAKIGIGTQTPAKLLHLESTMPEIYMVDSDASNDPNVRLFNNAGNYNVRVDDDDTGTGGNVLWYTSGTERMRLSDAGNLGIGTTSPGHKLHVTGPPDDSGDYAIYADEGNDNYVGIVNRHSANRRTALFYRNIHADYTSQPMVEMHNDHASDDQTLLKIQQDGSGKALHVTGGNDTVVIDGSGSPVFSVKTTAGSGQQANIVLHGARNAENTVGQITFSNVDDSGSNTGTYSAARILAYNDGGDKAGGLKFYTTPTGSSTTLTTRITIRESGKVGIGTTAPAARLQVAGSAYLQNATANLNFRIHADTDSSPAPRIEMMRGAHDTWGSGDNYCDWRITNENDLIFYSGFSGQSSGAAVERFRIHSDEDGLTISGGEVRNNGVGGTYSSNQLTASDVAFNLCTPFYYARADIGTGTYDLRIPNGGDGEANLNGHVMPKDGKVKAITMLFSGPDTPSTSNDHTWMIRVNGNSSSDTQTFAFDIDTDMTNTNGTNYTTTVVDGQHGYSEYSFSAGELLQIRRSSSGGSLDNVNCVLWVMFD